MSDSDAKKLITYNGFTIEIVPERNELLTNLASEILHDRYLLKGETPQEGFARASCAFASDQGHAQRLYDYVSKLWFMFATPLLANGGTNKGLPISCFLNKVDDSLAGLSDNLVENIFLSSSGGGIGTDFSQVRSSGTRISRTDTGTTPGIIPFIKVIDSQMLAYHQSGTRRGSSAIYLDVSHPEIEEFIEIRKTKGADLNRRSPNIHHAVNIPDAFMEAVESRGTWDLVDPHTKEVRKTVKAMDLWKKILRTRVEHGEPYIHFIDASNRALPQPLKDLGHKITQSNLCSEILLPTSPDRTAVCCLSSINLAKLEEWDNVAPQFIEDMVNMLDNALQVFIDNAPDALSRAVYSAQQERSIGLGTFGFHSLLQSKLIPLESQEAAELNESVFEMIHRYADHANYKLGQEKGEAPEMKGTGKRLSHVMAVAPNASSALIAGVSPSIEPLRANVYTQKTLSGSHTIRNRYLRDVLRKHGLDTNEVWQMIASKGGSVQDLDVLSVREKAAFKTAIEIDQAWLVRLAAERQPFICQGQSLNLFFEPEVKMSRLHEIHIGAWKRGLKTLYYLRSEAVSRAKREPVKYEHVDAQEPAAVKQTSSEIKEGYTIECVGCEG